MYGSTLPPGEMSKHEQAREAPHKRKCHARRMEIPQWHECEKLTKSRLFRFLISCCKSAATSKLKPAETGQASKEASKTNQQNRVPSLVP